MSMSSVAAGLGMGLSITILSFFLVIVLTGDESFFLHSYTLVLICILALLLSVLVRRFYSLNLCFDSSVVTSLEGRVVYDSSFTAKGGHLMRISLSSCTAVTGDRGMASGVVPALGDVRSIISSGVKVRLEGRFSEGLFIYDRIQVLSRSRINDIREYLVVWLQNRVLGVEADEPSILSCLLLMGRADNCSLQIRDKAISCGCAHVLALSGMHLGILAGLCRRLFGGGRVAKAVSYAVIAAFLFIAGPRPSLVRAALVFFLAFIPSRERIFVVFLVQMILFPATMVEIGCCYGYAAVFAIIFISPYLDSCLYQFLGRVSRLLSASVSVLVLCIPVQMASEGQWRPSVIIASPAAGALAAISMLMGLLLIAFGRVSLILGLNRIAFTAMDRLFDSLSAFPESGWLGYAVLLVSISSVFALLLLVRRLMSRKADEGGGVIDLQSVADLEFGL